MRFLTIISILFMTSCASYVENFHRQIDRDQRGSAPQKRYSRAQNSNNPDRRPINNPKTLNGPTAGSVRNVDPSVRRQYVPSQRRARSEDFVDQDSDGSLWSGKETGNFLFVTNNVKRKGDIVIVEVMKALKEKIQDELKRKFPERPSRPQNKKEEPKAKAEEKVADDKKDDPNKIYDKISTSVIELVNQDYLMLRGRKEILYKKVKRYFEFQAVVSQKDITSSDTVRSNKVLEPKINVLRY